MALVCGVLAACGSMKVPGKRTGSGSSSAGNSGSSSSAPAAQPSVGNPHDKLSILDVKIGQPMEQPGFVCSKDAALVSGEECVKFLDPRCTGQASNIGPHPYGSNAPLGCFLEQQSFATFLDNRLLQQASEVSWGNKKAEPDRYPLINLHTYGTRSTPSKIYRIVYTMGMDELASGDKPSGSKLYNALVAKYGKPDSVWSGKVSWHAGETAMTAYCDLTQCNLDVQDSRFSEVEQRRQEEADAKARQNAAPAPRL